MATFERGFESSPLSEGQFKKYPLKRMEPAIQKFLKVIQIDLMRLDKHRLNVEKYNRLMDWTSLHTEQVNATRTVQQIKANIYEIEKTRLQVLDEDLSSFDQKIERMKHAALRSVKEFVEITSRRDVTDDSPSSSTTSSASADFHPLSLDGGQGHSEDQFQIHDLPENTAVAESWDHLQENLEELNSMIHQFSSLVNDQQEKIDNIEANVDKAHSNVSAGVKQLGKAVGYKAAILPIAGAAIGTIVAGPVGLVAGAKIGAVLGAVGGGTAGFLGGTFLRKRQDKVTEVEMSNLSRKRTNSLPEKTSDTSEKSWFSFSRKQVQSQSESEAMLSDSN